eukprot:1017800_1
MKWLYLSKLSDSLKSLYETITSGDIGTQNKASNGWSSGLFFGHNVSAILSGDLIGCEANYGGAQANVFSSIHYGGAIAYSSNIAWEDPTTHDEYEETEELFESVNDALEFEIDVILIDIW